VSVINKNPANPIVIIGLLTDFRFRIMIIQSDYIRQVVFCELFRDSSPPVAHGVKVLIMVIDRGLELPH